MRSSAFPFLDGRQKRKRQLREQPVAATTQRGVGEGRESPPRFPRIDLECRRHGCFDVGLPPLLRMKKRGDARAQRRRRETEKPRCPWQ